MRLARFIMGSVLPVFMGIVVHTAPSMAIAGDLQDKQVTARSSGAKKQTDPVRLGLHKSIIVDLPRAAKDVVVSSPDVADVVMRTSRRAYIMGVSLGQTNVFFFDEQGRQVLALDLQVEQDLAALDALYRRVLPDAEINAEILNGSLILSGNVKDMESSAQAVEIATRFSGGSENVVNMLSTRDKEQVFLKVVIAEVHRVVSRQLGMRFNEQAEAPPTTISQALNAKKRFLKQDVDIAPPLVTPPPSNASIGLVTSPIDDVSIGATITALEKNQLLRTLAEPTLTAISGEEASFLAGGEFPVPVAQDNNKVTIEFKPFGVALGFTPVVLSGGRINMKVKTEVSELTSELAITLESGLTIQGLRVRRASTTVELPSGGSLVIAGLIEDSSKQNLNGFPGIMDAPILGSLFRSREFMNSETEMVVVVTPYLARPTARKELSLPTDTKDIKAAHEVDVSNRIKQIYGVNGVRHSSSQQGKVGFIVQ